MLDNACQSAKKQKTLIFLCWLIYTMSYIGRYSYKSNIVNFSVSDSAVTGLVMSFFYGAYGVGQIINGLFCSKYNKRIILPAVCVVSALCNLAVGIGAQFVYIKYLWLINGICLSVLWSSLILTLSENLDEKYLKTAIFLMSTTVPVGTFVVYGVSALFSTFTTYHATFLFATVGMFAVAIVWFALYQRNLSDVKITVQKEIVKDGQKQKVKLSTATIITVVIIGVFAVVCNLIKDGVQTWTPSVLKEQFMLGDSLSTALTLLLPVVGVFGSMLAIALHKKIGNYILVLGILFALSGGFLAGVMSTLTVSYIPAIMFLAFSTLAAQATNNVITSIVPLQMRTQINSGLLAGILNGCCYVGSTISGYGLGAIASGYGWNSVFVLLAILCGVAVVVSVITMLISFLKSKKGE
ncbi:MAG: MFS transporter [Clostridia bacterium]|nr:MFS transporter [Clostridia bacterium]